MTTTRLKEMGCAERRSEPRHLCAELVHIHIQSAPETEGAVANLEEISPSGACIQYDHALQMGVDIEIHCRECRLRGKVRHCRFAGIGYDIGIQFNERGAWSRDRFEPAHLLDVTELRRAVAAAEEAESGTRAAAAGMATGLP
jgi:hypothetical protein